MTHHTDAELLPCPFCGTAAKAVNSYEDDDWRVECWNDECSGHGKRCQNRSDAVLAWNRRAPAAPVPQGYKITEEQHVAAVKVLHRAAGVDGLPQRMLDAMLAAAPQPPEADHIPGVGNMVAVPVQLPEAQAEVEVRSMKTYLDLSIHEWRDTLPDGTYNVYTDQ